MTLTETSVNTIVKALLAEQTKTVKQLLADQDARSEDRTKQLLADQDARSEDRTKQLLADQDARSEDRTKTIIVDAIQAVVMPVLDEILETQRDHTERLERIEGPHKIQEARLDDHDRRLALLEAKG